MGIGYQFNHEDDDPGILNAASTDSETSSCEHRGRYPCVLFESATEITAEHTACEEAGDVPASESAAMRAGLARTDDKPLGLPTRSVLTEKKHDICDRGTVKHVVRRVTREREVAWCFPGEDMTPL